MKKVLSSILITVVLLANLFAPVSVGWERSKIGIGNNKTEAYDWFGSDALDGTDESGISVEINPSVKDREIRFDVHAEWAANSLLTKTTFEIKRHLNNEGTEFEIKEPKMRPAFDVSQDGFVVFDKLEPNTTYKFDIYLYNKSETALQATSNIISLGIGYDKNTGSLKNEVPYQIKTLPETEGGYTDFIPQEVENNILQNDAKNRETMPACDILTAEGFIGCLAQGIYYLIFVPTSVLFALAGTFFDNTFAYSVNDASYRSAFVVQGWNVVRDFCNMFFIFVLLYIAFKTILDLNGAKTKEMIVNVVIIGLLINFSLFATRVIIDVSNVLARVFYNSNTIQITALDNDGDGNEVTDTIARMNKTGVLPLSSALVNKVNPQSLIINAKDYGEIPDTTGIADTKNNAGGVTTGTFIFITLLASGINIVGFIVFLSVGLIFVIRVVALWLAMIFAPFAFFSYTVPKLQGLPMVGLQKWWPETLSMAFLAPVFIFFLYLILQFLEVGLGVADISGREGMLNKLVAIVIPFAFIMVLLMKAKGIAVKMSGEMGAAVAKAGSAVGGLALGAGVGLGAMAMRGTIGAGGSAIANSKRLAQAEAKGGIKGWGAKQLINIGGFAGKGSMDIRGTKLGASAGKGLGTDLGKAKQGGFDKFKEEKDKKRKERAEKLKNITTKAKQADVTAAQIALKETMLIRKPELDTIDRLIAEARQEMTDANNGKDKAAARAALAKLKILQGNRKTIRSTNKQISVDSVTGGVTIGTSDAIDSNGNIVKTINDAEKAERDALHAVSKAESVTLNQYANAITSKTSRTINLITSLGQDRRSAIEKTSSEIRKGVKAEKDKGDVGH